MTRDITWEEIKKRKDWWKGKIIGRKKN